jgi:hypothetical protein
MLSQVAFLGIHFSHPENLAEFLNNAMATT